MMNRVLKIYLRDRVGVFMSLFTVFIILALYAIFLGPSLISHLEQELGKSDDVKKLVEIWVFSGILTVTPITVSLSVFHLKIEDDHDGLTKALQVTPLSRMKLVMSYFSSGLLIAFLMTVFSLVIGVFYLKLQGAELVGIKSVPEVLFLLFINAFCGVAMTFMLTSFVKSKSAFSTISTIIGTAVGFLAGIYLPIGQLPPIVQSIMKFFPFTYGAARIRELLLTETAEKVFNHVPSNVVRHINENLGIQLYLNNRLLTPISIIGILFFSGLLFIFISTIYIKKRGND